MSLVNLSTVKALTKSIEGTVRKNAPQILAGLGIAFGVGAVGMTVKGTVSACKKVQNIEQETGEKLSKKDILKEVWVDYVPTVALTAASIGCVVGSVRISARRIATLGLAYAMSDKSFKEYQEKAKELFGEKKEEELRGSIAQDYITKNPPSEELICNAEGGATLCLDRYSGQYFYSDADTIKRVVNEMNRLLLSDYYVSLNDLYIELGINQAAIGDSLGWNVSDGELIEPEFTTELTASNRPVLVVDFMFGPKPNFRTINGI